MVATTDATQPSGSNDVVLTAAQRAELALDEVDVDGTGTVSETRGLLDSALNVLVKIQDALGPHHTVTPAMLAVDSRSTTVERAHAALRWPGLGNRL